MISFVYFDVGGVVVDDFYGNNKWDELKQELDEFLPSQKFRKY